ncbi:MAG: class I SAM-dependent methyltransferase [Alphaproteobacteria bacterium]|nr:MAG: class I SAM-dependent methyltransferase [Alphaproteobacteria bacterium]
MLVEKYVQPFTDNVLLPWKDRDYEIGRILKLSIPAFSPTEATRVFADLQALADAGAKDLDVHVVITEGQPVPDLPFAVQVTKVETPRLVLSLVLWFGHIYLPPYLNPERAQELKSTLDKLGIAPIRSRDELLALYRNRNIFRLRGKARHTRFLYANLRNNIDGTHYGFREAIDLDIVRELPAKFDYFNRHCTLNFVPIRDLNRYPGRVSRQYVVGQMYQEPYFQTGSVLDIGCDIRGVSEYVDGKYIGVDIQGLGDYQLDLDKDEMPFADRSFATVLCFEVLEHLNKIHESFDKMLKIADKYFIGSLFIESGVWGGKSISRYGDPLGNMHLPLAPIFDRHEWIFSVTDALDFIYYRARRAGFVVVRLDIFYDDAKPMLAQLARLKRAFRRGDVAFLARHVMMVGFVLERMR